MTFYAIDSVTKSLSIEIKKKYRILKEEVDMFTDDFDFGDSMHCF